MSNVSLKMYLALILVAVPVGVSGQDSAHWWFLGQVDQVLDNQLLASAGAIRVNGILDAPAQSIRFSDQVPHPFVYDPSAERSHPLHGTLAFEPTGNVPRHITVPLQEIDGSFTIEMLVRHDEGGQP